MDSSSVSRRQALSQFGLAVIGGSALGTVSARADETSRSMGALDVRDFGAKGDATHDDTEAFAAALKAAATSASLAVFVPRGHYLIKGHLDVPANVMLEGVFKAPSGRSHNEGSVLLVVAGAGDAAGEPFLTLHTSSTLRGLTVFYPEQTMTNPPVAYPWTIRGSGDNISIIDVLLVNPYQAVDFGTTPAGRHYINGLYGQPLYRGIFIDQCLDVGRIENVHFWDFWGGWEGPLAAYTRNEGVAFLLARTDWEFISNCFCIGYRIGFHFVQNKMGPGNCVITSSGSDIGRTAVKVDASQAHAGHTFVNCQFMSGVEVAETNAGPVKFTACGFWGIQTTDYHALLEGSNHTTFNSCHFIGWDQRNTHSPAIHARKGGLTVTACDFMDVGKKQVQIEADVDAALVYGNRFRGAESVVNQAGARAQVAMNVVSTK